VNGPLDHVPVFCDYHERGLGSFNEQVLLEVTLVLNRNLSDFCKKFFTCFVTSNNTYSLGFRSGTS